MTNAAYAPGSTLITNTMLCQAGRFLDDPSAVLGAPIDAFFDFCTLVETVILRDRLVTLDGDVVGYSADYKSLPLVSALHRENILSDQTLPIAADNAKRAIISILGPERALGEVNIDGFRLSIANLVPMVFEEESDSGFSSGNFPEGDKRSYMMLMSHRNAGQLLGSSPHAFAFFRGSGFLGLLRGTGDTQRGGYALRTFLYRQASVDHRVCFTPDHARISLLQSTANELHSSIIVQGCAEFSKKLECEAADFLADASPLNLPTPPFTSLLLSRCRERDNLIPTLLELRLEFEPLRRGLRMFEESMSTSSTIKEHNEAQAKVASSFSAFAKKFQSDTWTSFAKTLDFAGDLARPAFNPTNPGSYKSSLIAAPVEWLRDWWRRRPLVQLFDVAKKFRAIERYNTLVTDVFGVQFSAEEIERFGRARKTMYEMISNVKEDP